MGRSFYGEGQTSPSICVIAVAVKEDEGCGVGGCCVWGGYSYGCWLERGHVFIGGL
jgi:hypothetical protein